MTTESTENDARLDRVLRVLDKWGIDLADERSTLDQGEDFTEAIREDGAWRFVRDMRSALVIPPGVASSSDE